MIITRQQQKSPAIEGVLKVPLRQVVDSRGDLTTVFVKDGPRSSPVQWNLVRSKAGVIRGVHVHPRYDEYYVSASKPIFIFLKDARRGSSTFGRKMSCWMGEEDVLALTVPAGVAHGVAFPAGGLLLYGLSDAWTGNDELGCRWDDAELGATWPVASPVLSSRDANAGSYRKMLERLDAVAVRQPV